MNFEGYTPQAVPRFGSLVSWDAPVQLPLGLARIVRNGRYTAQSSGTRYGLGNRLTVAANNPLTGVGVLRTLPESGSGINEEYLQMLAYGSGTGDIFSFTPFVNGTQAQLTTSAWATQTNILKVPFLNPTIAQGFNRGFIAQGYEQQGQGTPLIYDPPTGNLDQCSDQPFAFTWTPSTPVRVGQFVSPSTFAGAIYRCTANGTTFSSEPSSGAPSTSNWPALYSGGSITDGTATWTEATPVAIAGLPDPPPPITPTTTVNSGSPITNGATVFLALTQLNTQGESINELINSTGTLDPGRVLQWTNTTGGPVNLTVTMPAILALFGVSGVLGSTYGATAYNLYAYIVQGTPNVTKYTDPTYYAQVGGPYSPGATVTISAFPTGQAIPTVNTANVTAAGSGSIDTGVRFMVIMFQTRTTYITGWNGAVTFRINVTNADQQLLVFRLPQGAYNHADVVLGLTVAGGSSAGPYTYVSQADTENPGFNQPNVVITATILPLAQTLGALSLTRASGVVTAVPVAAWPLSLAIGDIITVTNAGAFNGNYVLTSATQGQLTWNQSGSNVTLFAGSITTPTTTQAILNFTDTYLPGASDVTNYADRVMIPPASDIYFSKALSMMVYSGCTGYQSGHLISDFDDPEAVRIPGSNIQVADSDGDRCVCWREVREVQLSFKENGCIVIGPNDGDPNTWAAQPLWEEYGPCGPKAVDIAVDDTGAFIFFVCESGPYLVTSSTPQMVGRELIGSASAPGIWKSINWAAASGIKVLIDSGRREVRILCPTGGSTSNNTVITLNYFYGWEDPVIFAQRSGRLVPNVNGRKWSIDDIGAGDGIFLPQRYSANPAQSGVDLDVELVFAGLDGNLYTVIDGQYHDDTATGPVGYLSQWVSVPGTNPGRSLMKCGGGTWSGVGAGALNIYAFDIDQNLIPLTTDQLTVTLAATETTVDVPCMNVRSPAFGIGFDNGGIAGAWWEVHTAVLYIQPDSMGQINIGN